MQDVATYSVISLRKTAFHGWEDVLSTKITTREREAGNRKRENSRHRNVWEGGG